MKREKYADRRERRARQIYVFSAIVVPRLRWLEKRATSEDLEQWWRSSVIKGSTSMARLAHTRYLAWLRSKREREFGGIEETGGGSASTKLPKSNRSR
jgi:hypothetical protein